MSALDLHPPRVQAGHGGWSAIVAVGADSPEGEIEVVIPAFSMEQRFGPMRWAGPAGMLPQRGDPALVVFDDEQVPWASLVAASGVGAPSALAAHLADASDAHDASAISYAGGTGMSATDVEAAVDELATEKANVASAVMDGDAAGGVLAGTYPNPGFAADMATQAELDTALALKAPLASPTFTGNPAAPTPATADSDTSIATTAHVHAVADAKVAESITNGVTGIAPSQDQVFDALALKLGVSAKAADSNLLDGLDSTAFALVSQLAAEAWVAVSGGIGFTNSWVNFGGGNADAKYRRDALGFVELKGVIKDGTAALCFTLPAGYRPLESRHYPVVSNTAFGAVRVDASGDVLLIAGSNAYFDLTPIRFRAEQ